MMDIPQPFLVAAFSVSLGALVTWLVTYHRNANARLKEANAAVATNDTLTKTTATQKGLIDSLEKELAILRADLAAALSRVSDLERIVGDLETRLDIRDRHRATNAHYAAEQDVSK